MKETVKTTSKQMEEAIHGSLSRQERQKIAIRIGSALFAGGLLLSGKLYQLFFPTYESIAGFILLAGAIVAGAPIFKSAVEGFTSRISGNIMEQLVSLALLASIASGNYETAILIPLVLSLVHFLEERSILGAQSAIDGLKTLQAKEACRMTAAGEEIVPSEQLKPGDMIKVSPGDMFPIDGQVTEGISAVDQSSLTGEMLPVDVHVGDFVYAGTINIQGVLMVTVTKEAGETSLSKIVALLKEAEQSRTPVMRIIEKYAAFYLPLIIIIAIGVLFTTQSIDRAIAILIVSCPCAQVLVSATAMVASLAVASRNGVLIKNSAFLEVLGDVKTVIFDKTGTLTVGHLEVASIHPVAGIDPEELMEKAAIAAWASKHPSSRAIIHASGNAAGNSAGNSAGSASRKKAISVTETAGMGLAAITLEGTILLGNYAWLETNNVSLPCESHQQGSMVWVAFNQKLLGHILLEDQIREDAKEAIRDMRNIGIGRAILVTGDRKEAAGRIKTELALDDVFSGCLPSDKLDIVEAEKADSQITMVLGDGINDALALVKADIGVAMGAMGSDIAVQSADIALMGNELSKIPFTIRLSRKTKQIIYQNMVIAAASSAVMLLLAGLGIITPLAGAFLHNIGAALVLLNSARLLKFDRKEASAG